MTETICIRPAQTADIPVLERLFPQGGADKHACRLVHQQNGHALYLIAFLSDTPVGHVLLKWNGAKDEAVRIHLHPPCPDLEDLFVREEYRQQGIATRLLRHAEDLVRQGGFDRLGLAVGLENFDARRLYEHLGYREAGFGTYLISGMHFDEHGTLCTWEEECVYLIKNLASTTKVPHSLMKLGST